jgi:hypothetical protein
MVWTGEKWEDSEELVWSRRGLVTNTKTELEVSSFNGIELVIVEIIDDIPNRFYESLSGEEKDSRDQDQF